RSPATYSATVPSSGSPARNAHACRGSATDAASAASRESASRRENLTTCSANVLIDIPGKHVQRHVAAEDDGVVEALEIELRSERSLCLVALPVDLAVPDLVAARLPRPGAIPVDFARDFFWVRSVHVHEEADTLLERPLLGVNPGVDDQGARAERDRLHVTEAACVILVVGAELVGEPLRIQPPAFRIGVEGEDLADSRHLVRVFTLPDVARDRLVEGQVVTAVLAAVVARPDDDHEEAG